MTAPFAIDDYTRRRLLAALDDIGLTLRHKRTSPGHHRDITAFEATRPAFKPTTLPVRT